MRTNPIATMVLLAGALTLNAQQPSKKPHATIYDAAATFSFERAQVAQAGTPSFWLKGGSLSGSATVFRDLGLAANFTLEHTSNVTPGVNLGKFACMFGPRYTVNTAKYTGRLTKNHPTTVFGEWLFGGAHAYDSLFPSATTTRPSANASSMQLGGGLDLAVHKGFGLRPFEIDYIHTNLPNNASNRQNDLRIAFGVSYRR